MLTPSFFIVNDSTASLDTVSSTELLTQDIPELAYPTPMDEDTEDSTEPTTDSQTFSTINSSVTQRPLAEPLKKKYCAV